MDIGARIKEIRKSTGNTQQSFGEALGLKRNTIATYEIGQVQPSERTISDICRLFNVSELWLREGQGEMFLPIDENQQLEEVLVKMKMENANPFADMVAATLKAYYKLSEDNKKAVNEWVAGTISELTKKDTPDG